MKGKPGRLVAGWGLLFLLLAAGGLAIEPGTFDISGQLTFSENGEFPILQDERCEANQWIKDPSAILGEEKLNTGWFTGSHAASGCSGGHPVYVCLDPPITEPPDGNPVSYLIPVCEPDGDKIKETDTYLLGENVTFDNPPCNQAGPNWHDKYRVRFHQSDPLNHPQNRKDPPDCPGDRPCLINQDMDECAGALVIEYMTATGVVTCPGHACYPPQGNVQARMEDFAVYTQAETKVAGSRQTRFPVRAGDCRQLGTCTKAEEPAPGELCELVLWCPYDQETCDFGSESVACMSSATQQKALTVDVSLQWGSSLYEEPFLYHFGRRLLNVPIACGAVTRVKLGLPCGGPDEAPGGGATATLTGYFEVLGYGEDPNDEVLWCDPTRDPQHQIRTPYIALEEGPSDNARRVVPEFTPVDVDGFEVHPFTVPRIPLSDQPSIQANDKNYSVRASFVLVPPDDLDEWVAYTSFAKGRWPDQEQPPPLDPEKFRNSTGYALFRTCAKDPGALPGGKIIAHADRDEDWLYFKEQTAYTLERCELFPDPNDPDEAMCTDVKFPLDDYPSPNLERELFVMAPREIQGCLVLDDMGLADAVEALKYQFSGPPEDCTTSSADGFSANSRAETLGITYDEDDTDPDGPCDPTDPGNDCADSTANTLRRWEPWLPGKETIYSRLVLVDPGNEDPDHCPLPTDPDVHAFRYRVVPGQTGNLHNAFITKRFRLNFESNWGAPIEECPVRGALRVNPTLDTNNGNGVPLQLGPQEVAGQPGAGDLSYQRLDACLGIVQAYIKTDAPMSREEGEEPSIQGRRLMPDPGGCGTPRIVFGPSYDDQDTGFLGTVDDKDDTHALVVMPLQEGTYRLRPSIIYADGTSTLYPEEPDTVVTCGQVTRLCTANLVPDPSCSLVEKTAEPVALDGDCKVPIDITLELFDCDQGEHADLYVTIVSDDIQEPGERGFPTTSGNQWTDPLEDQDTTVWDNLLITPPLDQECAWPTYTFHLWLGDGPVPANPADPHSGVTTFRFTILDPQGNQTECEVTVGAIDTIPPTLDCSSHVECISTETLNVTDICASNLQDNCDLDPDLSWEAPGATPDQGTSMCAEADFPAGLTPVTFTAVDDFESPENPHAGICEAEARLPSEPVPCIQHDGETCEDACAGEPIEICQNTDGPETLVPLDGDLCTDADRYPDDLPDNLTYAWTFDEPDCPAGTWIENPGQPDATLHIPSVTVGCDVLKVCDVTLRVEEEVQGGEPCVATTTRTVKVHPAPVADPVPEPHTEYHFCETPPDQDGFSYYQLDGSESEECEDTDPNVPLTFDWVLSNCNAPADLVFDSGPAYPRLRISNDDLPVEVGNDDHPLTCDLTLTVTDDQGRCSRTASTTITVHPEPLAVVEEPDPTCMEKSGDWTDVQLDGSQSDPRETGCGLEYFWSHVGCPPGTHLVDTGDPAKPILRIPNDPDPVTCQACLQVQKPGTCGGCISEPPVCVDVQTCPNPDADFDAQFTLNLYAGHGTCRGQNQPPQEVEFLNETMPGDCGYIAKEYWQFPPDGDPLDFCASYPIEDLCAPNHPIHGLPGSSPIVEFSSAGIKLPSLQAWEKIGEDALGNPILCDDTEEDCICAPSCVNIANTGDDGAVMLFRVDCTPSQDPEPCINTGDLVVVYQFYDIDECCDEPFDLAPGMPAVSTLTFDPCVNDPNGIGPDPSPAAKTVTSDSVVIRDFVDHRLRVEATYPADCLIDRLVELGCYCDTVVPEIWVRLELHVTAADCLCEELPLVIDQKLESAALDNFKIKCNDNDCLDPDTNCPCP